MKKITTLLLALLLCCSLLVACNGVSDFVSSSEESSVIEDTSIADSSVDTSVGTSVEDSSIEDSSIVEPQGPTLADAIANINVLYRDKYNKNNITATTYKVVKQVMIEGVVFPIVWTVDVTEGVSVQDLDDTDWYFDIVVGEAPALAIEYVLTATVADEEGNTLSTSYNLVVPAYKVNTYAEYAASANGDNLVVRGIVIGIESKDLEDSANSLFLQDLNNEGGYYVYGLSELPEGIAVGMTVEAAGAFDNYNGTFELKDASVKIIDETITEVAPVDYTEAFTNAADTKAEELVSRQAMLVTIKGVTITDQNAAQGYLNFTLGGKTAYLRISSSHNCITVAECNAMKALHAESFGCTATVTGYVAIYSGAFYLCPVSTDAISEITVPERSDAEKVELEKTALTVVSSLNADTTITLPTAGASYENVAIAWESNSEYAVVNGGEVAITVPDEKVTVTLTATLTLGEVSDTATFEIVLNKVPTAIAELNELGLAQGHNTYTAEKYIAEGIITEVANETYGNLYIQDNNGDKLYVYGLYWNGSRYDKMATKPAVGDYVRVTAAVGQYNGTAQMKNADVIGHATASSLAELTELGVAQGHNTYTTEKYLAVATVKEVYNTTYGNLYLTDDATASFTVYGLYDVLGVRFDKLANKPEAGDIVGIYGVVGQYNGTAQIKNGVIVYWQKVEAPAETCPGCGADTVHTETCEYCGELLCKDVHSECNAGGGDTPVVTTGSESLALSATSGSLAADSKSISWTATNFTFVNEQYNSTTPIRTSDSDHFRAYKGSLTTITALNGAKITKVVITRAGESKYTLVGNTVSAGVTVTENGTEITLTCAEAMEAITIEATGQQWRLNNIVVYYEVEATEEPDPTCPGCGESTIHTETCEYCGELLCKGDHSACAPVVPENPFTAEYNLTVNQENLGKVLYFAGSMSGYYFATTEDAASAAVVTVEATAGGYHLAFTVNGGAKQYIKVYASGTYTNVGFGTTAECVFSYNETYKTFTTVVNGTEYYIGTYNTFNTLSASKISYAASTGNFTSYLVEVSGTVEPDPTCPGCGESTIHTETCEYCGELLCKDVHANCGATEEPTTISIADALAAADGAEIVVKGIVKSIDTEYSSQYNNISVTITDGTNDLYLYRLSGNVEVDSIITVTGKMATYNNARQVAAGATFVLEGKHEHNYVEGVCEGCGKNEPKADTATISFASTSARTVLTTTQQVWEQNGITVTNNKASSTSNIADYAAPARFYANTELIIEFAAGISKIEFTTAGGKNFASSFTYAGATVTVSGTSCIMEFATPVTSISFTLSAQIRVSQIVING